MTNFEVFTIGGGRFLFDFFNAVAAIVNSTSYQTAIILAALLSFVWMLWQIAFNPVKGWGALPTWIASLILMYSVVMLPTAQVKITDRVAQIDSSGYVVSNVPFGLAFFAGTTSTIGDALTTMFETNFGHVNEPKLNEFGWLFGVRLLAESTHVVIKDEILHYNLGTFLRNCVFYDILQGRKSYETFANSADPWVYISSSPSQSRMASHRTSNGAGGYTSSIETCGQAASNINAALILEADDAMNRLVNRTVPQGAGSSVTINPAVLKSYVAGELSQMHDFLIGTSKNSVNILRDQMVMNAYIDEITAWNADKNNAAAVEAYARARMDIQTRAAYDAVAMQGEKWVPILKTVFQALYYGAFSIALLLMMTPVGVMIFRNYFMAFVWLESWGPLYAILHHMMNVQARDEMHAATANSLVSAITFASQPGIQAVEADISNMAGYLSMSVPFISLAIAFGANRMLYLANSTLGITQQASSGLSQEIATGNMSLGNTQTSNHSFSNVSGWKHDDNVAYSSGLSSAIQGDGTKLTQFADDSKAYDNSLAQDRFSVGANFGEAVDRAYSSAIDNQTSRQESLSQGITQSQNAIYSMAHSRANQISETGFWDDNSQVAKDASLNQSVSDARNAVKAYAHDQGITESEAVTMALQGKVGVDGQAGIKAGAPGVGSYAGASLSAGISGTAESRDSYEERNSDNISQRAEHSMSLSDAVGIIDKFASSHSAGERLQDSTSFNEDLQARKEESIGLQEQHSEAFNRAESLREEQRQAQSAYGRMDENLTREFREWIDEKGEHDGAEILGVHGDRDLREKYFREFVGEQLAGDQFTSLEEAQRIEADYQENSARIAQQGEVRIAATDEDNQGKVNPGGEQEKLQNQLDINRGSIEQTVDGGIGNAETHIDAGKDQLGETITQYNEQVDNRSDDLWITRLAKDNLDDLSKAIGLPESWSEALRDAADTQQFEFSVSDAFKDNVPHEINLPSTVKSGASITGGNNPGLPIPPEDDEGGEKK